MCRYVIKVAACLTFRSQCISLSNFYNFDSNIDIDVSGLSIQWGIIGDVGVVHRNMGEDAVISGVMAQRIKSCLDTLDYFMVLNEPVVTSYVNAKVQKQDEKEDILTVIAKAMGMSRSIYIFCHHLVYCNFFMLTNFAGVGVKMR